MTLSPVLNILGLLTTILGAAMLIPMCFDLYFGSPDWQVFALSSLLTAFVGVSVWLATSQREGFDLGLRQAFLLTNGSWISIGLFGALPFIFSELQLSLTDAVFESVSGITTTGSTVLRQIELASPGILIWRALLQWLGGVGIIVMAMAVLPMLSVGGMQLFRTESYDSADKVVPRAAQLAGGIGLVYASLTALWAIMLSVAGMSNFDAIAHAMTTIATGGFSTESESIMHFRSPLIEWIAIFFMALSATTFLFVIRVCSRRWHLLRHGQEVYWFYIILLGSTFLLTVYLVELTGQLPTADSFRTALFQAVSIMTTTGYASADFEAWLPPAKMLLIILMFVGGCSGSTAGGIKVVRVLIAVRGCMHSIVHALRPNLTLSIRMAGKPVRESALQNTLVFLLLCVVLQILSMLFVSANEPNLSFLSTFSCVQSTLFNIGPGFDQVGPFDNFQFLRGSTKLYLSLLMTLGRLELYAVLVLFSPMAWRRFF